MKTAESAPSVATDRFRSLEAMRAAHAVLIESLPAENLSGEQVEQVMAFLRRGVSTGTLLDSPSERQVAQGLLNYWTASLYTQRRNAGSDRALTTLEIPTSLLADFDTRAVGQVIRAADNMLDELEPPGQDATRRVLLRLVRLQGTGTAFEPATATRSALERNEDERQALRRLEQSGILRVTPGPTTAEDSIGLAYDSLTRQWPRLANWLEERILFREAALFWDQHSRVPSALLGRDTLTSALAYNDLNAVEQDFVNASSAGVVVAVRQKNAMIGVLCALLLVSLTMTVIAWSQYGRSNRLYHRNLRLEREKLEAIELDATATSTSTLAIALLLMSENRDAVHAAKKVLIIQTLSQCLFALDKEAAKAAVANWKRLEGQLVEHDPRTPDWFWEFLRDEHREEIEAITSGRPAARTTINNLKTISSELKQYIVGPETVQALDTIRPVLLDEAVRVADRVTSAAKAGKPLSDVELFRLAFWRLSSGGLLIVADDRLQMAVDQFADALKRWEDAGGVAPSAVTESLATALDRLRLEQGRAR